MKLLQRLFHLLVMPIIITADFHFANGTLGCVGLGIGGLKQNRQREANVIMKGGREEEEERALRYLDIFNKMETKS